MMMQHHPNHHHDTIMTPDQHPSRLALLLAYARSQSQGVHACAPVSLYVKNLPPNGDELWLYKVFAPFGAIASVRSLRDRETNALRGVGFVNFVDAAGAHAAMAQLNDWPVDGRRLGVELQRPVRHHTHPPPPPPPPPCPPQPLPPPPPSSRAL